MTASEGSATEGVIHKVQEAELEEMWSFVGNQKQPRWLWEALDRQTGRVVAYGCGRREDQAVLRLKAWREAFGMRRFYTDGWGAYQRYLAPNMESASRLRHSWNGNLSPLAPEATAE